MAPQQIVPSRSRLREVFAFALLLLAPVGMSGVSAARATAWVQESARDYVGRAAEEVRGELGGRAKFVRDDFSDTGEDGGTAAAGGCILAQFPHHGAVLDSNSSYTFVVASKVVVPPLNGTVAEAVAALDALCLDLEVMPACGAGGHSPQPAEMARPVDSQCTTSGTVVDVGGTVGVVIGPLPAPKDAPGGIPDSVLFLVMVSQAIALLALAIVLLRSRRQRPDGRPR